MPDRREERRALFESILADPHASHSDRLRADEQLRELEQDDRRATRIEDLAPDEVLAELQSLSEALPGFVALQRVACGEDPDLVIDPPTEEDDLRSTLELAFEVTEVQARRILGLEAALQRLTVHRLLPRAQEPIR